jgi:hypothetical protein
VADDPTPGEIARNQSRLESRVETALKNSDDRLADLASKMVPTELWKAEHQDLQREVKELRDELRKALRDAATGWDKTSLERMGVLNGRIDAVAARITEHEKGHAEKGAWSRNRTLTTIGILVTAVASIVAAWVGAVLAAKGVH